MQIILALFLLLTDFIVSYLLVGSLKKKLMANENSYATEISIVVGFLAFVVILIGGGIIILLSFPFER
ncbi:hypothetical protein [Pinibacter soli]|uniref:Uncharacterized protein n=1 Tax=Pinibacter soli TaxID=3044211 RepID=A0ABT6RJ32_9BACT|nr:hypothetical protein [Pinibacter soli]MDI3322583.1 hypothetical protein [Pinibacter soli]